MSDEPSNATEDAADFAMTAFRTLIEKHGGSAEQVFISAHVEGLDPSAVTAGWGFEDDRDLLAFLLVQARGVAKAHGLRLDVIEARDVGQG